MTQVSIQVGSAIRAGDQAITRSSVSVCSEETRDNDAANSSDYGSVGAASSGSAGLCDAARSAKGGRDRSRLCPPLHGPEHRGHHLLPRLVE